MNAVVVPADPIGPMSQASMARLGSVVVARAEDHLVPLTGYER